MTLTWTESYADSGAPDSGQDAESASTIYRRGNWASKPVKVIFASRRKACHDESDPEAQVDDSSRRQ